MKPLWRNISALILVLLSARLSVAETIWHTSLNEARREAERVNRPILCHFGAKWCAPCQKMERLVLNQPNVTAQMRASVVALKIDIDEHPELAQRFGVERFPTDVFLEPNGQRLMESTGFHSADEYISMIDRAGRRYTDLLASRQTKSPLPLATSPEHNGDASQLAKNAAPMLMLEGYCPVTLQKTRRWEKGDPQWHAEYKGQLYQFVSAQVREEFLKAPDHYVPQLLGCDPVIVFTTDRVVPGSIEWGAFYDDRLYLFTSEEHRRKFKESPDKYVATRVVLNVDQIESIIR